MNDKYDIEYTFKLSDLVYALLGLATFVIASVIVAAL